MLSLFKWLFIAVCVSSYKSLPFVYYVRFYTIIIKNIVLVKYFKYFEYKNKDLYQVSRLKTYNSIFECDFYLHKSNSCYFEELDIARTQVMTSIFQKFFLHYKTESKSYPFIPVANIFTSFQKEIKPFAKYSIDSKVLAWDSKWLFIISKFVLKNGKIASTTITKYVLKDGRKTISPVDALKFEGLWTEEIESKNKEILQNVEFFINTNQIDQFPV